MFFSFLKPSGVYVKAVKSTTSKITTNYCYLLFDTECSITVGRFAFSSDATSRKTPASPHSSDSLKETIEKDNTQPTKFLSTLQTSSLLSQLKEVREKPWFDHVRELQNAVKYKDTQEALSAASKALNEFTGYSDVERLKQKVIQQEDEFLNTRQKLAAAKRAYEEAISTRSTTQREINDLLQRKHLWSNDDVMRFTELYRNEHLNEQREAAAKEEYRQCEKQVEKEYTELTRSIMMRYHEEQIWSDKIRSASTYGTIALMFLNVLLFICVQTVFEPRKRQKLANKFEQLLLKKSEEEASKLESDLLPFIGIISQQQEKIDEMLNFQRQSMLNNETHNSSKKQGTSDLVDTYQEIIEKDSEPNEQSSPLKKVETVDTVDMTTIEKIPEKVPLLTVRGGRYFWAGTIVGAISGIALTILFMPANR
ncbi:hypothetical protein G9A89_021911 [Geosiphon pyriformis]|nr:hypothetical protein G9A89_021911 [Geosiphon pyriformis]